MTLDEWMQGATRGDGRRFRLYHWDQGCGFEPIFRSGSHSWFGLHRNGMAEDFSATCGNWEEYKEPPKTKKVKMYRPIRRSSMNGHYWTAESWDSAKEHFNDINENNIVGWQEMECEVADE